MKRGLVPAIPFIVSLGLSLSTVGSQVYWQDSGVYLTAVKDLGVLYPPGFVLYLVCCKAWTLLFSFLDFTLAVHLFSSVCVAGAAAFLSLAVRDFLCSRGEIFRSTKVEDSRLAAACGIAAGTMAAAGYTMWFTGIYAKGYAFYYLILAALIWRLIRADEQRTPRDFTIVAVLIGLAWSAHPSSVCLAAALVGFVVFHRRTIGTRGLLRNIGISAAVALAPAFVVLPLLAWREPLTAMGDPRSIPELFEYAIGLRFMGRPGGFGLESERAASFGLFLWEEFLLGGVALFTAGMVSLVGVNGRLVLAILIWVIPYSALAILFKVEGQHDCWFVAAWMPLHLLVGLGLFRIGLLLRHPFRTAWPVAAAAAALAWSVSVNRADLDQRRYTLAWDYGRVLLDNLDRNAILVLNGDDSLAIAGYMQRVKGFRPDVAVVVHPFLGMSFVESRDWYDDRLLRERPYLRKPDYAGMRARHPGVRPLAAHLAAFLEANAGRGRDVFTQTALPPVLLPAGTALVPAGALWKLVPSGDQRLDPRYWQFPLEPEDVQGLMKRERGIRLLRAGDKLMSQAEAYETRLLDLLLKGRVSYADMQLRSGRAQEAIRLLDTVRGVDPTYEQQPTFLALMGQGFHAMGDDVLAEKLLQRALTLGLGGGPRGWVLLYLGEIRESRGRPDEALAMYAEARVAAGEDARLLDFLSSKQAPPKER